jgi:hypothetical protein
MAPLPAIRTAAFGVLYVEHVARGEIALTDSEKDEAAPNTIGERTNRGRELPPRPPSRMWGGTGSGVNCAICGELIGSDQLEYELEYPAGDRRARYHVHVRCCAAWELQSPATRLREPHE